MHRLLMVLLTLALTGCTTSRVYSLSGINESDRTLSVNIARMGRTIDGLFHAEIAPGGYFLYDRTIKRGADVLAIFKGPGLPDTNLKLVADTQIRVRISVDDDRIIVTRSASSVIPDESLR
jgi:hypothetical protein